MDYEEFKNKRIGLAYEVPNGKILVKMSYHDFEDLINEQAKRSLSNLNNCLDPFNVVEEASTSFCGYLKFLRDSKINIGGKSTNGLDVMSETVNYGVQNFKSFIDYIDVVITAHDYMEENNKVFFFLLDNQITVAEDLVFQKTIDSLFNVKPEVVQDYKSSNITKDWLYR